MVRQMKYLLEMMLLIIAFTTSCAKMQDFRWPNLLTLVTPMVRRVKVMLGLRLFVSLIPFRIIGMRMVGWRSEEEMSKD